MIKTLLIISGSVSLTLGLYINFKSIYLRDKVMGRVKYGLPIGDAYEQKDYDSKMKDSIISEACYCWGMGLTLLGIVLSTYGALL